MTHAEDDPEADAGGGPVSVDWTEYGRPSVAVVEAVAAVTNRDPAELSPLHDHVDTDGLDRLLASGPAGGGEPSSVSFVYEGVAVTAESVGRLVLREAGGGATTAGPTSGAELERELRELLLRAHRNGVSVDGGWEARNGPGCPDWELVVTELEKRADDPDGR